MRLHRTAALVAALGLALTGCGSDGLPSKAEFIDQVSSSAKKGFTESLTASGVAAETAADIFDNFAGCVYDQVKDDEDLLRQVQDDSSESEFQKVVEEKASPCIDQMTTEMTGAMTDAIGGDTPVDSGESGGEG